MGKAADWLREERRNVLGHWTAFCLDCGAARRWFVESEDEIPDETLEDHIVDWPLRVPKRARRPK